MVPPLWPSSPVLFVTFEVLKPLFFFSFCLHKLMSSVELRNAIVKAESESDSATNAGR